MSQTASQPVAAAPRGKTAILRAQGVKKTYKMGDEVLTVLKQIDLTLQSGEFVAIEGRSGSGKSTLLHILGALDAADTGTIEYEGRNIAAMGGNERSRLRNTQFGFVFQFYHLLPELSVVENTLLGPMIENSWFGFKARKRELRERAQKVLADLGLSHRLKHKPNQLSGGERQRVAIARALIRNPRLLLCDEPTGNLDAASANTVAALLLELLAGERAALVVVTHSAALASRCPIRFEIADRQLRRRL